MSDYTSVARVKQEIRSISLTDSPDDALLGLLVTAASRAWDRACTGAPDAEDYFISGSVVNEVLRGQVDYLGSSILCYPHKPIIESVQEFSFQENIIGTTYTVDPARIEVNGPSVRAYPSSLSFGFPSQCRITISYTGGLGATYADLPEDMQEAVAILAVRFFREAETGLADQIGVAELGQLVYTKAWPIRVQEILQVYKRHVGWRHVA